MWKVYIYCGQPKGHQVFDLVSVSAPWLAQGELRLAPNPKSAFLGSPDPLSTTVILLRLQRNVVILNITLTLYGTAACFFILPLTKFVHTTVHIYCFSRPT